MRVNLHGDPPDRIRDLMAHAGLQITPDEQGVHVVWLDASGRQALRTLANQQTPALAIVEQEDQLLEALLAGAAGTVSGTDPQRMRLQIECHGRLIQQLSSRTPHTELRDNAAISSALLMLNPDPVVCADLQGNVFRFNPAAETSLGYSRSHAMTKLHVMDLYVNPQDARRVRNEIQASPSREIRDMPVRLRTRSGDQMPALLNAAELTNETGEPMGTIGVFRDLRTERDLRQRLQDVGHQLRRSEQKTRTVVASQNAVNELNQPLTALMGTLELMELRGEMPEDIRLRLARMYQQLQRMVDIVRLLNKQSDSSGHSQ